MSYGVVQHLTVFNHQDHGNGRSGNWKTLRRSEKTYLQTANTNWIRKADKNKQQLIGWLGSFAMTNFI